jgi:hypothetical protein
MMIERELNMFTEIGDRTPANSPIAIALRDNLSAPEHNLSVSGTILRIW